MKKNIGEVSVKLTANTKDYKKKLGEARKATDGFAKKATSGMSKLKVAFAAAGITAGLTRAFNSLNDLVDKTMKSLDTLAKSSLRLGITTKELQEFHFAAEMAGVSISTFDMAFQRFTRRMADAAATGKGELAPVLKEMKIDLKNTAGVAKTNVQVFREFADKIAEVEDPAERVRLAFKAFDSEGVKVIQMLQDGASGLDHYAARAHELGIIIDRDLIAGAEEYMEAQAILNKQSEAIAAQITKNWAPVALMWDKLKLKISAVFSGNKRLILPEDVSTLEEANVQLTKLIEKQQKMRGYADGGKAAESVQPKIDEWIARTKEIAAAENEKNVVVAEGNRLAKLKAETTAKEAAAEKEAAAFKKRGIELTREAMTADELWAEELAELNAQLAANADFQETYNRQIAEHNQKAEEAKEKLAEKEKERIDEMYEKYRDANEKREENTTEMYKLLEDASNRWMDSSADAMTDFVMDGKADFKGLADSIIRDLIRIQAKQALMSMFGGSAGGGGGGMLGGLVKSGVSAYVGWKTGVAQPGDSGFVGPVQPRASGGRYQKGQPLLTGERGREIQIPDTAGRIIPQVPMGKSEPSNVSVQVNNTGTAKNAQVTQRQVGEDMVISVLLDDLEQGGTYAKNLQNAYGIRRS